MATTPAPQKSNDTSRPSDAISALRSEVDRLFDDFGGWGSGVHRSFFNLEPFRGVAPSLGAKMPVVNVAETDKEFEITAELPGISEKATSTLSANANSSSASGPEILISTIPDSPPPMDNRLILNRAAGWFARRYFCARPAASTALSKLVVLTRINALAGLASAGLRAR